MMKEAVKKLIDDFPKVKLFSEQEMLDNSMQSTMEESLDMSINQRAPSAYDMIKQMLIQFQKQIQTSTV